MFKHLLIPTDGSTLSQDAVAQAIDFAQALGARVTFFMATKMVPGFYLSSGMIPDAGLMNDFRDDEEASANEVLSACVERAKTAGVSCDTLVRTAEQPWQAIIDAATAAECDLIFMASHGRRGIQALLLGSETQKVLTHSRIPVLVYR